MKRLFVFSLIIIGFMFVTNCYKDEQPIVNQNHVKVISVDIEKFDPVKFLAEVSIGRSGGQQNFNFPLSGVLYNPFTAQHTQIVMNLSKVDSVTYSKISTINAFAFNIQWGEYDIVYYFKDGTTRTFLDNYAPKSLGNYSVIIPNVIYNQLKPTNTYNYVSISRTTKSEKYPDLNCGTLKSRLFYIHQFGPDSMGVFAITGKNCNSSVFNYEFLVSE